MEQSEILVTFIYLGFPPAHTGRKFDGMIDGTQIQADMEGILLAGHHCIAGQKAIDHIFENLIFHRRVFLSGNGETVHVKMDFYILDAHFNLVRYGIETVACFLGFYQGVFTNIKLSFIAYAHRSIPVKDRDISVIALVIPVAAAENDVIDIDSGRCHIGSNQFTKMDEALQLGNGSNVADAEANIVGNMAEFKRQGVEQVNERSTVLETSGPASVSVNS